MGDSKTFGIPEAKGLNIKQTTSQNVYILYESLAGNQRNLLS